MVDSIEEWFLGLGFSFSFFFWDMTVIDNNGHAPALKGQFQVVIIFLLILLSPSFWGRRSRCLMEDND